MAVTWFHPRAGRWDAAGLAVPCPTCNVTIGEACDKRFNSSPGLTHESREERAAVFGFQICEDPMSATLQSVERDQRTPTQDLTPDLFATTQETHDA